MEEDIEFTFNPDNLLKGFQKVNDAIKTFEKESGTKLSSADKNVAKMSMSMQYSFDQMHKPFQDAMTKMTGALDKLSGEHSKKSTKMKEDSGSMSSFMVAKGMVLANIIMGLSKKVFNFIKNGVPEVAKTFSIVGDILQRNLFWPLRKELAPVLQNILNWTRDHRAMFVRWGGVLVNVFRAITAVIKGFVAMYKALFEPIANKLKEVFKGVGSDISDVFNVVLFKITAVVMFLQAVFMPLVTQIGDTLAMMVGFVSNFFEGFANGVAGISEPFSDLVNELVELGKALTLSSDGVDGLGSSFKALGDLLGTVIYTLISGIAEMLDGMTVSIKNIVDGVSWAKAKMSGNAREADRIIDQMDKRDEEFSKRTSARMDKLGSKWGSFVDRTKAEFSPNSSTSSKQINATSKVNVEKIEILVAPGDDVKKAGEGFIEGMNKKASENFKNILLTEAQSLGH